MLFVDKLKVSDYKKRVEFAVKILQLFEENNVALTFRSDGAHFHFSWEVNK